MATVLKMLLAERHLKNHPDFLAAYDRYAAQLDPPIPPGHGPAKAQFYQWLSGRMIGLPRDYHCRVLAEMFPGWTVEGLFQMADSAPAVARSHTAAPVTEIELEAFLGAEMVNHGTTLVYPTFELTRRSVNGLQMAEHSGRRLFGRTDGTFPARYRLDAPAVVAENDIRGLLYVFALLQRHTNIPVDVESDREIVAHSDRPYISFGLSGNDSTRMYVANVRRPLFTILDNSAENGAGQHLELVDGTRFNSRDNRDLGIVARVRPSPDLHPDRYWIYCAGFNPHGTAGAGWYLANYWSPLQQRAGDREFVAVLDIRKFSHRAVTLKYLLVGSTE